MNEQRYVGTKSKEIPFIEYLHVKKYLLSGIKIRIVIPDSLP